MKAILAAFVLAILVAPCADAEETMRVAMDIAIGEGPDQEVRTLHQNDWTKLVQITLRNGKPLNRHLAREAVTIQCVSGNGVLVAGDGERISLTPGVIVPLEPGVPHSVEAVPAVSVLVTRFLHSAP